MEKQLISIIVPVYNTAIYLNRCIESILSQTYSDIELILVDDGSTDESGKICEYWKTRSNRVFTVHKSNSGQGESRNIGLHYAHGEWIAFIDSDDYLSPVYLEVMYKAAIKNKCSIVSVPCGISFSQEKKVKLINNIDDVPESSFLEEIEYQRGLLYQKYDTAPQWRLYKREILGTDPFPVGVFYEDLACVYRIIHNAGNIAFIDCKQLYAYRVRSDSSIRQAYHHNKGISAISISAQLFQEISLWYPTLKQAAASRCFSICRMVYAQIPKCKKISEEFETDAEDLWKEIRRYRGFVISDSKARKRERIAAVFSYTGRPVFDLFCVLCRKVGLMR